MNGQRPKPAKPGFLLGLAPWAASAVELVDADDMWRDAGRRCATCSKGIFKNDPSVLVLTLTTYMVLPSGNLT